MNTSIDSYSDNRLHQLCNWNLGKLEAFLRDQQHFADSVVADMVAQYRRFHIMILENPNVKVVCCPVVMRAWEVHVLMTKEYGEFCATVHGRMVHHMPFLTNLDKIMYEQSYEQTTLPLYYKQFGKPKKGAYWQPIRGWEDVMHDDDDKSTYDENIVEKM